MPTVSAALPPHQVLADGPFAEHEVTAEYQDRPRPSTPELDALIDAEWRRRTAAARDTGAVLFNGRLLRHLSVTVHPDPRRLHLVVGPCTYREFLGTNLYHGHRVDEFGWERFGNAVGTSALVLTRDGKLLLGRRSDRVAFHGGAAHTFGGVLEACDLGDDGRVDPCAAIRRELHEELALDRRDVLELTCTGLVRDFEIHQPELLFEARVACDEDEVRRRWQTAESRAEHVALLAFDERPAALRQFLATDTPIAPVARAALEIAADRRQENRP